MKRCWGLLLLIMMVVAWAKPQTVHAETLHYSVSAKLPANQQNANVSYFDLLVTPGSKQTLTVVIKNQDTKAHTYRLQVNRATTNTNGAVDYNKHGVKPASSLTTNIETMVKPVTTSVAAGAEKPVALQLTVPKTAFVGKLAGGIRVVQVDHVADESDSGISLTNRFAYVVGLMLQQSTQAVAPKLVVHKVAAKQLNYRNNVTIQLENTAPTFISGLKLTAQAYQKGQSKPLVAVTKVNIGMAPNSVFNFPVTADNLPLRAGKFTMKLTAATADGKYRWHFTRDFTISNRKARNLNRTAVDQAKDPLTWPRIVIGVLAVLIVIALACVVALLEQGRRKH